MIHELLEAIDHDTAKQYREDTAEEPEFVEEAMSELRYIVALHLREAFQEGWK